MFKIKKEVIDFIREDGFKEKPIEACGYLAGNNDIITQAIKMRNVDNSPDHFSFEVKEQFDVVKKVRNSGMQIIGIYHTHPETPARMSEEDIRLANDTNIIYLIYSLKNDDFKCFKITTEKFILPLEVEVI